MKRPITIILSVIGVILILSIAMMRLMGPKVGNTFSFISSDLDYGMGGGGAGPSVDMYAMESPASAPLALDASRQAVTSNGMDVVAQQVERKVIKDANLSVIVKDPQKSMDTISAMAEELGGYVVNSNVYQTSYGPNNLSALAGNITIRIPAEKLNEVLDRVKKDAVEVTGENISGQDVTDQYVDLTSRLAAKEDAAKKLTEIMEKAEKTEDVMAVYAQLQQVQTDIEVLKGQIKFIDQSVAMSSVTINMSAESSSQPIEIGGWKIQGTAKEAIQGLVSFLQGFVQFLIRFFLNYLWRLILIFLPLYGVFVLGRAVYRRMNRSKAAVEVTEVEKK
ncbi:MAG: DUF4349 domain-containing protein [Anaerolineales bacterium]